MSIPCGSNPDGSLHLKAFAEAIHDDGILAGLDPDVVEGVVGGSSGVAPLIVPIVMKVTQIAVRPVELGDPSAS